jgi:hypothetical protein
VEPGNHTGYRGCRGNRRPADLCRPAEYVSRRSISAKPDRNDIDTGTRNIDTGAKTDASNATTGSPARADAGTDDAATTGNAYADADTDVFVTTIDAHADAGIDVSAATIDAHARAGTDVPTTTADAHASAGTDGPTTAAQAGAADTDEPFRGGRIGIRSPKPIEQESGHESGQDCQSIAATRHHYQARLLT